MRLIISSMIIPKLIIDTDPGHDDVMAILLAVKSGLFDIKAITTVAGNSVLENATKNACFTLDLLDRRDIPVYSGQPKPLKRELILAVVHGESGLDGVDTSKTKFDLTYDAEDRIIELVQKNPGITLLTLGPLSNIARALIKNPKIEENIKQIVMMGGAINVPGNKNRVGEFNFVVDPDAADVVFKTNIKKILVPIDICNDMLIPQEAFEALNGNSLYKPVMDMMKKFIDGIEKFEGVRGALIYDAVAAYYLINPKAFKLEEMDIAIETQGEHTFGMTVVERRKWVKHNNNVSVALKVNKKQFMNDFFKYLNH